MKIIQNSVILIIEGNAEKFAQECNWAIEQGYSLSSSSCGPLYRAIFVFLDVIPPGKKFNVGERVSLTGIVGYPEYNGKIFTIKAWRTIVKNQFCHSGFVYYVHEKIPWGDTYIYEERLQQVVGKVDPQLTTISTQYGPEYQNY